MEPIESTNAPLCEEQEDAFHKGFCKMVPPLGRERAKGSNGRIGIVGGSNDFTGAPYFAGLAALKSGADLVYILTTQSAVLPLKSYCPEFIVTPNLPSEDDYEEWHLKNMEKDMKDYCALCTLKSEWILKRLTAVIVGPGLGVSKCALWTAALILQRCIDRDIPIIIDADGIRIFEWHKELLALLGDYEWCILTPNARERPILLRCIGEAFKAADKVHAFQDASMVMKGPTFVEKGFDDTIHNKGQIWTIKGKTPIKHIGGMGDILVSQRVAPYTLWS